MYKKRSKFGVNVTKKGIKERTYEGIVFDSLMELRYFRDYLKPLQAKGEVINIVLQPKYVLQPKFVKNGKTRLPIYYIADYEVLYSDNRVEVIDVKGLATNEAKIKRKLFDFAYPKIIFKWVSLSRGIWWDYDELQAERRKNKREKS